MELPPERYPFTEEQAERWIDWIKGSGVDVVGDVDDLRPEPVDPDAAWLNPDTVSAQGAGRGPPSTPWP